MELQNKDDVNLNSASSEAAKQPTLPKPTPPWLNYVYGFIFLVVLTGVAYGSYYLSQSPADGSGDVGVQTYSKHDGVAFEYPSDWRFERLSFPEVGKLVSVNDESLIITISRYEGGAINSALGNYLSTFDPDDYELISSTSTSKTSQGYDYFSSHHIMDRHSRSRWDMYSYSVALHPESVPSGSVSSIWISYKSWRAQEAAFMVTDSLRWGPPVPCLSTAKHTYTSTKYGFAFDYELIDGGQGQLIIRDGQDAKALGAYELVVMIGIPDSGSSQVHVYVHEEHNLDKVISDRVMLREMRRDEFGESFSQEQIMVNGIGLTVFKWYQEGYAAANHETRIGKLMSGYVVEIRDRGRGVAIEDAGLSTSSVPQELLDSLREVNIDLIPIDLSCGQEGEYALFCCNGLQGFDYGSGDKVLCYDATQGEPECRAIGSDSEGWYYSDDGDFLKYANCSLF